MDYFYKCNKIFFEHTSDTITITDDAGIIRYVNPAFEKVSGFNKEEIMGKTIVSIALCIPKELINTWFLSGSGK